MHKKTTINRKQINYTTNNNKQITNDKNQRTLKNKQITTNRIECHHLSHRPALSKPLLNALIN